MKFKGNLQGNQAGEIASINSDSGSADAYAVTLRPAVAAYTTGLKVVFLAANANTTASTLAVNGLAAKTIKKSVTTDLSANDILAGQIVEVIYDGTNFQMISTLPSSGSADIDSGVYLPDETDIANIDSTVVYNAQWLRVEGTVTVSGRITITPTAGDTNTRLSLSVPLSGPGAELGNAAGTAAPMGQDGSKDFGMVGAIYNNGDGTVMIDFDAYGTDTWDWFYHYTYQYIPA